MKIGYKRITVIEITEKEAEFEATAETISKI